MPVMYDSSCVIPDLRRGDEGLRGRLGMRKPVLGALPEHPLTKLLPTSL